VHGVDDLTVGELVLVADEDSQTLKAEVVASRPGAADLRVCWNRRPSGRDAAGPMVHVELGPVQRQLGITEIGDADRPLEVGDRLELVDEGGHRCPGEAETGEPAATAGARPC
jgi:hypothetical protein